MKPTSFVSTVGEISAEEAVGIPNLDAVISYWTDDGCTAEEWFHELNDRWGPAGFAVRPGTPVEQPCWRCSMPLACASVKPCTSPPPLYGPERGPSLARRRLLVRMLRDLRQRGFGKVQAIASDRGVSNHVPTSFLLESGWQSLHRAPYRMSYYTLAHIDLKSAVEVGELARALVGRVKLPGIQSPVPGTLARSAGEPRSR